MARSVSTRRRIVVAIVATTLATLVATAVMSIAITRLRARDVATAEVSQRATAVANQLSDGLRRTAATSDNSESRQSDVRLVLSTLRDTLGGASIDTFIVSTSAAGVAQLATTNDASMTDIDVTDTEILAVAASDAEVTTIVRGGTAYGLSSTSLAANRQLVVVAAEDIGIDFGPLGRWFVVGSVVALAGAAIAANRLAERISAPLVPVTKATGAIARGGFDTRIDIDAQWPTELAELAAAVNDMAEALHRSKGLEQQFLMSVSHDLRTPLTSIRGFAEALADGTAANDSVMAARSADIIVAQSRRLERLVQDLLELARLDGRQFSLDLRPTDIGHLITTTSAGFAPSAVEHGLNLGVSIEPGEPMTAVVDPDRVAQIVANLVENATKFAASAVHVTVRRTTTSSGTRAIEIGVHDDGPGIAGDDLPHVFERLYVAKRHPVRQEVGSGLGLAIVSELASSMGGTATARRSDLGGACLAIVLAAN